MKAYERKYCDKKSLKMSEVQTKHAELNKIIIKLHLTVFIYVSLIADNMMVMETMTCTECLSTILDKLIKLVLYHQNLQQSTIKSQ
jgi:deoxycytidylate deaminase